MNILSNTDQLQTGDWATDKRWAWFALMFSAFYFLPLSLMPFEIIRVTESLLIYVIFIVLYVHLQDAMGVKREWLIVAILSLAVFGMAINPGANVFFGFAAFYCGFYFSKLKALITSVFIVLCLLVASYVLGLVKIYHILPGLIPIIASPFLGVIAQQAKKHSIKELHNQKEKHQLITMAERERIARDLHDTLGHTLSLIALKSQLAKKLGVKGDMEGSLREISQIAEIASQSLSEVRQVVSGYHMLGIDNRIKRLQAQLEAAGFEVKLSMKLPKLPIKVEAALMLIMTEAVTNILRHSQGEVVSIQSEFSETRLSIKVHDNGNVESYEAGNGLEGMKTRVEEMGGKLIVAVSTGFSLTIQLALNGEENA